MLAVLFAEFFVRLFVSRNFRFLFREHSVSPLQIRVSVALCPLLDSLKLNPFMCVARLPVCVCLFQASNFSGSCLCQGLSLGRSPCFRMSGIASCCFADSLHLCGFNANHLRCFLLDAFPLSGSLQRSLSGCVCDLGFPSFGRLFHFAQQPFL
jgi:hypothetical protein